MTPRNIHSNCRSGRALQLAFVGVIALTCCSSSPSSAGTACDLRPVEIHTHTAQQPCEMLRESLHDGRLSHGTLRMIYACRAVENHTDTIPQRLCGDSERLCSLQQWLDIGRSGLCQSLAGCRSCGTFAFRPLVWALSVPRFSGIAIEAERLESAWEFVSDQPAIKNISTNSTEMIAAMSGPVIVDVVDGKKQRLGFAATLASCPVVVEHGRSSGNVATAS